MALTFAINSPEYPEGTEFDIGGVVVENGGSVKLTEDNERTLVSRHQTTLDQILGNHPHGKVSGSQTLSEEEVTAMTPTPVTLPAMEETTEEEAPPAEEENGEEAPPEEPENGEEEEGA